MNQKPSVLGSFSSCCWACCLLWVIFSLARLRGSETEKAAEGDQRCGELRASVVPAQLIVPLLIIKAGLIYQGVFLRKRMLKEP